MPQGTATPILGQEQNPESETAALAVTLPEPGKGAVVRSTAGFPSNLFQ